jgi:hypothetical protein
MFGTENTTLQEKIVLLLKDKKLSAKSLLVVINKKSIKNYSIQAIYDQLRIMILNEVLLKEKQFYVINNDWLIYLKHLFFETTKFEIAQNQKNIYRCSNLIEADKLWKNIFYSLSNDNDVFIYNPEPFWHFIEQRKESESRFYKEQKSLERNSYCVVGGSGQHYQNYKKAFRSKQFQIEAENIESMEEDTHITAFGEYVIYVKINEKIAAKIKKVFSEDISEKELSEKINNISYENFKHKFVLEHNPKKSLILKKRIARIFLSEKEIFNMLNS